MELNQKVDNMSSILVLSIHNMKELEISKVLNLTKTQKYEMACATFDLVDHIFKVDIPRSLKHRKLAVQAISLLSDGLIQYGYEDQTVSSTPVIPE